MAYNFYRADGTGLKRRSVKPFGILLCSLYEQKAMMLEIPFSAARWSVLALRDLSLRNQPEL